MQHNVAARQYGTQRRHASSSAFTASLKKKDFSFSVEQ